MRAIRRWIWAGIALYIAIPMLGGLISIFPGFSKFLYNIFLEALGTIPTFSVATQLTNTYAELVSKEGLQSAWSSGQFLAAFLGFALEAMLSTAIIGLCIKVCTEAVTRVTWIRARAQFVANGPQVLPTLVGIVLGVTITKILSEISKTQAGLGMLLSSTLSIGLLLLSIGMMLRYHNKRSSISIFMNLRVAAFLKDLVLSIVIAILCSIAITSLVLAPGYAGFSITFWALMLLYCVCGIAALLLVQLLIL